MQPSNLSGRAVTLLVAGGDAEDNGGLGSVVDVCVGEAGGLHQAGGVGSAVHPHEGQLGWGGGLGFGRLITLDGQVHRVLNDLPRRHRGWLPGQVCPIWALKGQKEGKLLGMHRYDILGRLKRVIESDNYFSNSILLRKSNGLNKYSILAYKLDNFSYFQPRG